MKHNWQWGKEEHTSKKKKKGQEKSMKNFNLSTPITIWIYDRQESKNKKLEKI